MKAYRMRANQDKQQVLEAFFKELHTYETFDVLCKFMMWFFGILLVLIMAIPCTEREDFLTLVKYGFFILICFVSYINTPYSLYREGKENRAVWICLKNLPISKKDFLAFQRKKLGKPLLIAYGMGLALQCLNSFAYGQGFTVYNLLFVLIMGATAGLIWLMRFVF